MKLLGSIAWKIIDDAVAFVNGGNVAFKLKTASWGLNTFFTPDFNLMEHLSKAKKMIKHFEYNNSNGLLKLEILLKGEATPITIDIEIDQASVNTSKQVGIRKLSVSKEWMNILVQEFLLSIIKEKISEPRIRRILNILFA